ncbi:hypothetical protein B7463_g5149, partial [Scytalidium lignicola]
IQGVEGLDVGDDETDQHADDGCDVGLEGQVEPFGPSPVRMVSSENAKGKDEVDDDQDNDTSGSEDGGSNCQTDIVRVDCPGNSQRAGNDTTRAEAEDHARHEKLLTAALIDLKDGHVGDGTDEEENQIDTLDGNIDALCGDAT